MYCDHALWDHDCDYLFMFIQNPFRYDPVEFT